MTKKDILNLYSTLLDFYNFDHATILLVLLVNYQLNERSSI